MNLIHFARTMRALGWSQQCRWRGQIRFGCHFGGQGVIMTFDLRLLADLRMSAREYASLVTHEANRRYGHPLGKAR